MHQKYPEIANRFKIFAAEIGLSQADIARATSLSTPTISTYFSGRSKPKTKTIQLLHDEYSLNPEWLISGQGSMLHQKKHFVNKDYKSCDLLALLDMQIVAKNLKKLRRLNNETQLDLSQKTKIHKSTLSAIETSKIEISSKHTLAICYHYNIDILWFLTGEGDSETKDELKKRLETNCNRKTQK